MTIPAHKFLYIKDYVSNGYFEFWERQAAVAGVDCGVICGLLDSIKGKLDGDDGVIGVYSGQIMAQIFEEGRSAQAYGVRLAENYCGGIPKPLQLIDVPAGKYLVFEHGSFVYEQECDTVNEKLQKVIDEFDYSHTDYLLDKSPGRLSYFYFDPEKFIKHVFPVKHK